MKQFWFIKPLGNEFEGLVQSFLFRLVYFVHFHFIFIRQGLNKKASA